MSNQPTQRDVALWIILISGAVAMSILITLGIIDGIHAQASVNANNEALKRRMDAPLQQPDR